MPRAYRATTRRGNVATVCGRVVTPALASRVRANVTCGVCLRNSPGAPA